MKFKVDLETRDAFMDLRFLAFLNLCGSFLQSFGRSSDSQEGEMSRAAVVQTSVRFCMDVSVLVLYDAIVSRGGVP